MIRKFAIAGVAVLGVLVVLGLIGSTIEDPAPEPEPTAHKSAAKPKSKPKAKPTAAPNEAAILQEATSAARGTSYAADLAHVKRVERDGEGLRLYTDMYSKDSNRADYGPASRAATPFLTLGYTPVRVYAANGELLIRKGN